MWFMDYTLHQKLDVKDCEHEQYSAELISVDCRRSILLRLCFSLRSLQALRDAIASPEVLRRCIRITVELLGLGEDKAAEQH
jgi:hypothetical protein